MLKPIQTFSWLLTTFGGIILGVIYHLGLWAAPESAIRFYFCGNYRGYW